MNAKLNKKAVRYRTQIRRFLTTHGERYATDWAAKKLAEKDRQIRLLLKRDKSYTDVRVL